MAKPFKKFNPKTIPQRIRIKRGDTVMVISGKDRGKTGTVKRVIPSQGRLLVEGLNMIKKAVRPNPATGDRGGLIEMEASMHVSKVMLFDAKAKKPTRIRISAVKGTDAKPKRVRVSVTSKEQIDN